MESCPIARQTKHVKRNIEARSCNSYCRGKAMIITQIVCVTLGIQHGMRMRHVVICGLSSYTTFLYIFPGGELLNIKCSDFLYNFYLKHLVLRTERDMIKMYIRIRVKCSSFLSDFNKT